jgi:hypothetical protein
MLSFTLVVLVLLKLRLRPQAFSRGSGTQDLSEKWSCVRVLDGLPRARAVRKSYTIVEARMAYTMIV